MSVGKGQGEEELRRKVKFCCASPRVAPKFVVTQKKEKIAPPHVTTSKGQGN